ncbi:MAG: cation diffusion facilitator family transporter [Bacteroidota bacterium]
MKSSVHRATTAAGLRTALTGVVANMFLAAVKAIAGIAGNSYALIADAIESTSDIASSLIVLGGLKIAAIPADEDHPYGHGKAEPIAAVVVSMALMTAAVGIAIESIREIATPHHAPAPFTLAVLTGVVIVKETLFRYVFRVGQSSNSTALKTEAWHHRGDAITSSAAFIGIAIALVGGEGYESADDYAALFASCIIVWNGVRLFRPAFGELMDVAPPPEIEQQIRTAAAAVSGVSTLDKCFVRKMGLEYYVDLHVVVNGDMPVRQGHQIAHEVKDAIRQANPKVSDVLVHIEPAGELI